MSRHGRDGNGAGRPSPPRTAGPEIRINVECRARRRSPARIFLNIQRKLVRHRRNAGVGLLEALVKKAEATVERVKKAQAKLAKLGIKIESIHYTQGYYDFVDIVDAPNPEAMLAFSVWYATEGLGRIQSMPAFDAKSFATAIKNVAG